MKPQNIRLFVKAGCGWCHEARQWLDARGIRYHLIDVTSNQAGRQEMQALSGQTLAPVLQADGRILADFDTGQLANFWRQFEQNP
jgi:glutaredoxin 3